MPRGERDDAGVAAIGNADRAAFLLSGAEPIRIGRRDTDVIQLCGGLVVPGAPSLAAVDRDENPLITRQGDMLRIVGADPHLLIVIAPGRTLEGNPVRTAVD